MTLYHAFTDWFDQRALRIAKGHQLHRQIMALALPDPSNYIKYVTTNNQSVLIVAPEDALTKPFYNDYVSTNTQLVALEKYRSILGNQTNTVIFDARHGINLDALVAISGLITKSGVLLLLLPNTALINTPDNPPLNASNEHVNFAENCFNRVINNGISYSYADHKTQNINYSLFFPILIKSLEKNAVLCVNESSAPSIFASATNTIMPLDKVKPINDSPPFSLSTQQNNALKAVCNKSSQTIVDIILGKRGRGKSTLLAAICAMASDQIEIVVSAPNKTQLSIFDEYLAKTNTGKYTFVAPDQVERVLQEKQGHLNKQCWLLVDEVASIAPSLLKQMLAHCNKAILAGTTQGYEGSGLGFIHRVLPYLLDTYTCNVHELTQAFRWYANDPIEALFEDLLGFSSDSPKTNLKLSHISKPRLEIQHFAQNIEVKLINKQQLVANKTLFNEVAGLLREAHYQTTANDIVRLLDAPDQILIVAIDTQLNINKLCGLCVLIHEGGEILAPLAQKIAFGQRRVQGHLTPQALAMHLLDPNLCMLTCLRVNRIAVSDEYRLNGIGSALLSYCEQYAGVNNIHYLSTSFGYTASLHKFWQANDFLLAKYGNRVDTSSGTRSALMIKSLSIPNKQQLINLLCEKVTIDDAYFEAFFGLAPSSIFHVNNHKRARPHNVHNFSNVMDDVNFNYMIEYFIDSKVSLNVVASAAWSNIVKMAQCNAELVGIFKQIHEKGLHKTKKMTLQNQLRNELGKVIRAQQ